MSGIINLFGTTDDEVINYNIAGEHIRQLSEAMAYISEGFRRKNDFLGISDDEGYEDTWRRLVSTAREMLAGQYSELAEMMSELATSPLIGRTLADRQSLQLKAALAFRGIRVTQLSILKLKDRGIEVHLVAGTITKRQPLSDEVAAYISAELGVILVPKEGSKRIFRKEPDYYAFRQKEKYVLKTGAVKASKLVGKPSGDNYAVLTPGLGETAIILSDGCGTGEQAHMESSLVTSLIGRFLQCGFRGSGMVSLISSVLLLASGADSYSTLDMCLVNLFDGGLKIAKSGASLTFIKHEDWVETISASGLPLGILPDVRPEVTEKRLYHGDTVIVLSDGVLDGLPVEEKEGLLQEMIRELPDLGPKDMAGAVLMASLRKRYYEPIDDMTVIAGRLERRL
jgi:stage II sporulation protein E